MESNLDAFLSRYNSFVVVALHDSNQNSSLSDRFFRWLARCILVLCAGPYSHLSHHQQTIPPSAHSSETTETHIC